MGRFGGQLASLVVLLAANKLLWLTLAGPTSQSHINFVL
jgi:hypothetical protein